MSSIFVLIGIVLIASCDDPKKWLLVLDKSSVSGTKACCTQGSLVSYVRAQVAQLFGQFWFSFSFVSTQEHFSFANAGSMLDLHMRTVPSASSTRNGSTVTKKASNAHLRGGSCICTSTSRGSGIGVDYGLLKSEVMSICVRVSSFGVLLVKVYLVVLASTMQSALIILYW